MHSDRERADMWRIERVGGLRSLRPLGLALGVALALGAGGCGDDDEDGAAPEEQTTPSRPEENTGQACETASECFAGVTGDAGITGVLCLDKVTDGYCTHTCGSDDDCCAVEGECATALDQVCSPFENTNMMMCFLSCEDGDIRRGRELADGGVPYDGADEATEFCRRWAGVEFICRSSGGGNRNRKICVPGGGNCNDLAYRDDDCRGCLTDGCCGPAAACAGDDDCVALVACVRECDGGDEACMDTCYDASPGGRSVYENLRYCMSDSCSSACPYDVP